MKIHVIAIFVCLSVALKAQVPNWQWANASTGYGGGGDACIDANGNIYSTGFFGLSNIAFGTATLTSTGISNFFITKHDASGNLLWAQTKGGVSDEAGWNIQLDASGNIYVTGVFQSATIVFGTYTLTNSNNTYPQGYNSDEIFIVKYDSLGNVLWAKSFGGFRDDNAMISFDASANMFVTGYFNSPTIAFGNTTLTNSDSQGFTPDFFAAKYDAAGNLLWARSAGGPSTEVGFGSVDANGNLVVTGSFQSPTITFGNITLTNAGSADIFIVKYDPAGNVLWAKSFGGPAMDSGSGSFDSNGNLIVTGAYRSPTIAFGTTTLTNTDNSGNTGDFFIAKYDGSGNVAWAKTAGGTSMDAGGKCAYANGNIFVTGAFNSATLVFGTTTLTNMGNPGTTSDIFIVKYDASGSLLWAKSAGGSSDDFGTGSCDAFGNLVLSGSFQSPSITFGSSTFSNNSVPQDPYRTIIFLAKLNSASTGIAEETFQKSITISPNPFSDHAVLQSDVFIESGTLTIRNALGETVKQVHNVSGNSISVPRDQLVAGVYLVYLADENKNAFKVKMVVTD